MEEQKQIKHLYNVVSHLITTLGYMADNQQQIMKGEIPFHGQNEFQQQIQSLLEKGKLIDNPS